MTTNGVQGGIGICPGGWSFKCLSRGVRRRNRSLSRGKWNNIEDCPGGVGQNRSLSRGHLQVCPWGVEVSYKLVQGCFYKLSQGYMFSIIVICRGVRLME